MGSQLGFARTHEWVALEGEVATVGITDFAAQALTDLVFIELPKVGKTFKPGDVFGVVESVKAASDLYAPVAGEVVEVNASVIDDLSVLSSDPMGKGWMIKLRVPAGTTLAGLMDEAAYREHCRHEAH